MRPCGTRDEGGRVRGKGCGAKEKRVMKQRSGVGEQG